MKTIFSIAAALSLFSTAIGAPPTRQEVSGAIAQMEKTGTSVEAARVIFDFADQSKEVEISVTAKTVPWLKEKWGLEPDVEQGVRSMLLAAYLAGNIKSQLAAGKPLDDPYSGWVLACRKYAQYRSKITFSSPSLESLEEKHAKGTLREYAREALKVSKQKVSATGSQPSRPATNSSPPGTESRR